MNQSINKSIIISSLIATSFVCTPSFAGDMNTYSTNTVTFEEKEQKRKTTETIGVGTGIVIGGIVAGPLGAIVASVTGALIAKHINTTNEVEYLTNDLVTVENEYKDSIAAYQLRLDGAKQTYEQQLAEFEHKQALQEQLEADNLLMSLQFNSGSSDIAAHYQEQVSALAHILNNAPLMKIDLSGYTDLAGEQETNLELSKARVESVKTLLMAQGVNEDQITTYAFGENEPVVANKVDEVSFYDRRVVLKLHNSITQTAKR